MPKEPELKARDKVVLRMKREGAVEEPLTAGNEQRVSKRPEDAELVKPAETAAPSEALSAEEQKKVQMRPVFFALPELLAVLAFDVDRQLEQRTGNQTDEQIDGMKAGQRICKGRAEHGKAVCQLVDELRAGSETKHW